MAAVGCTDVPMPEKAVDGPQLYTPATAPSALILSPEGGDILMAGDTWSLVGRVSDPDGASSSLRASWSYQGVELCSDIVPADDGIVTCEGTGAPGKGDLTLSVVDADGLEFSSSIGISVEAGEGPSIHVDSVDSQSIYSDVPVTFTGVASGEGELSVDIRSHHDGEFEAILAQDGSFSATTTLSPGDHVITVTVTDENGATSNHGTTIYVEGPNSIPNCAVIGPAAGELTITGEATTLIGSADDADVGAAGLSVSWSSSIDGFLGEGNLDAATGEGEMAVVLSEGRHTLEFTAIDEVGAVCTDTMTHVVGTAPTLVLDTPTSMLDEGVADEITATVTGAASFTGNTVVRWSVDGALTEVTTTDGSGTAVFDTSLLSGGMHTVSAAVRDVDGWEVSADVDVLVNGRPSAPEVSGMGGVTSSDDLRVSIDLPGVDPEGAPVTHSYTWYLNGSETSVSTTDTFPAAATARGDVIAVAVTAHDGRISSEPAIVGFTVENTRPTADSVTLSPAAPTSADSVNCLGTGSDFDGDAVSATYSWSADGRLLGTGATLPAGMATGGSTLVCTAIFTDGYGTTVSSSTPVLVGHSAPVIERVRFNQKTPTVETGVSITVDAYDADGEEFSFDYAWTVNGAPAGDGPMIASSVAAGDFVSVTVTARDAQGSSAPVTASVSIEYSDIYAPVVSLSPKRAAEGDELVCGIDTPAYDPDGSTLSYIVSWARNGELWEGDTFDTEVAGDTIDGADVFEGDEWTCEMVAEDGDRMSEIARDSVTVGDARETSSFDLQADALSGAGDSCGGGEAVVDGTLTDDDSGFAYVSAGLQTPELTFPHSVSFELDVAVCNAGAASDVTFSWGLFPVDGDEAVASGTEVLSAEGGCTCPDGASTPLTLEAVLNSESSLSQLEVRFMSDADEMALLPSSSASYVDVTVTH